MLFLSVIPEEMTHLRINQLYIPFWKFYNRHQINGDASYIARLYKKRSVSSAYWTMGKSIPSIGSGAWSNPSLKALFTIHWRRSAASTKRRGDKGSPCLTPLLHLNCFPGTPLRSAEDIPELKSSCIHCNHFCGKPKCSIIERIVECSTVSKALAKSSLKIRTSFLDWWHWCMYWKDQAMQSWIVLLLMKPY